MKGRLLLFRVKGSSFLRIDGFMHFVHFVYQAESCGNGGNLQSEFSDLEARMHKFVFFMMVIHSCMD